MLNAGIALIAILILATMSLRANRRFRHVARLPMQWSIAGTVNWTAPRPLALAFLPLLAAIVLIGTAILSLTTTPRPGQAWLETPTILFLALLFIAVHTLHLWLIGRTLKAGDR